MPWVRSTCVTIDMHCGDDQPQGHVVHRESRHEFVGWLELFALLRLVHDGERQRERAARDTAAGALDGQRVVPGAPPAVS